MNPNMAEKKPSSEDVERATQEAFVVVCRATLGMVCSYSVLVRRLLAHELGMVAPDAPGEPPENHGVRVAATNAVHAMYLALGVRVGAVPSIELRSRVREALGFHEPAAPEWVRPGAVVRPKWGGGRKLVVEAMCASDGNATVQLAERRFGVPCEPIPMGVFLAGYSEVADVAPALTQTITGTEDMRQTLHLTGTLAEVQALEQALRLAIATGASEARAIFGVPQMVFVRKGPHAIDSQPRLVEGGRAFYASERALRDLQIAVEGLSPGASVYVDVQHGDFGSSFERVIIEVREEAPRQYPTITGTLNTHTGRYTIDDHAPGAISHAILGTFKPSYTIGVVGGAERAEAGRAYDKIVAGAYETAPALSERARGFVYLALASLGQSAPAKRVWAHHAHGRFTVFVDAAAVGDDAMRRAEDEARKLVPNGVPLTVERSQMPALRALATAVDAALSTPLGQRHIAEYHIREDARRYPAFSAARRAVVASKMEASAERSAMTAASVPMLLSWLREYEDRRGIGREPSAQAAAYARARFGTEAMAIYERCRGLP